MYEDLGFIISGSTRLGFIRGSGVSSLDVALMV